MNAYHFAAQDDIERLGWMEALHDVTDGGHTCKLSLMESGQVRSSTAASAGSAHKSLAIHIKMQSEEQHSRQSQLGRSTSGAALDSIKIAGRSVRMVTVSKRGPIVGPLPLRRVARMLLDGSLSYETRLRVATSSEWITKPGIKHTIDTIDKLIIRSRAQRNARHIDVHKDLNEVELVQELNWLAAQQSEIAVTEGLLKSLAHSGAKALKQDSRRQLKRTLRALCFCTRAQVIKVADNAERFQVQVYGGDTEQHMLCYWYSSRVLQNVGLPLETLKERIMAAKGLQRDATSSASYSNMEAKLGNMSLTELHQRALGVGSINMSDLVGGIDINSATQEELSAALKDDRAVAAAIYDMTEHTQLNNESDARLHLSEFKEHHALALRRAGIRYPAVAFFDKKKSFHPSLQRVQDKDRMKDLGELTVEERMYDRRVTFDPLSCFYGYTTAEHSSWWFLVELLRKMVVNIVYLRGVDSCDNFPWQEVLIVFLIFYALLHNYEMPYHTRLGNFLEMFSTMFIVMVLHAATSSNQGQGIQEGMASDAAYLSGQVRASFVLALMVMMGVLFMVIKARDYMEKRQHKLSVKHAHREWRKLCHGIGLIERQIEVVQERSAARSGPQRLLAAAKRYAA